MYLNIHINSYLTSELPYMRFLFDNQFIISIIIYNFLQKMGTSKTKLRIIYSS